MRATISLGATFLFVLSTIQTLGGQTPPLRQYISSKSSQHVSQLSGGRRARFSDNARRASKQLRAGSSASTLPLPRFLAATQIGPGGAAIYRVVAGTVNGDQLPDVITLVQSSASPTGTYLAVLLGSTDLASASPILTPVSFAAGDFLFVADLNKDGKDDVILVHGGSGKKAISLANSNSMDVLLSMGMEPSPRRRTYPPESVPRSRWPRGTLTMTRNWTW